jgi:hypothetical protein
LLPVVPTPDAPESSIDLLPPFQFFDRFFGTHHGKRDPDRHRTCGVSAQVTMREVGTIERSAANARRAECPELPATALRARSRPDLIAARPIRALWAVSPALRPKHPAAAGRRTIPQCDASRSHSIAPVTTHLQPSTLLPARDAADFEFKKRHFCPTFKWGNSAWLWNRSMGILWLARRWLGVEVPPKPWGAECLNAPL